MGRFLPSHYHQKAVDVDKELPDEVLQKLCDLAATCPMRSEGSAIIPQPMVRKLRELCPEEVPPPGTSWPG